MAITKLHPPENPILTRELAKEFCEMRQMPGERRKKAGRLKHFRALLEDGEFNSPVWSQALVGDDLQPWRADGQHTSTVLTDCPEEQFPRNTHVTIFTYHLDSMQERHKLFDQFDNPKSARNNDDKLGTYIATYGDLLGLDHPIIAKALKGIAFYHSTLRVSTKDAVVVLPETRDLGIYLEEASNRNFCIWLSQWQKAKHNEFLTKYGIVAEIYSDWKSHPDLADKFWEEVLKESNPDVTDYTRDLASTLSDWCLRRPIKSPEKFREKTRLIWERWRRMKAPSMNAAA